MPQIVGSKVAVEFVSFPGQYPVLYYAAGEGAYNLSSANAGNSDGLCVGLEGVNGAFKIDLTTAGQKRVDLGGTPNDDYQDRHQRLVAKALADASHSAAELYSVTDPSLFGYVYAAPVTQTAGWFDGVCFVDIFDPALRPVGNAKNAGMLYVAAPFDGNYADQTVFLQAIETTAHNIVQTLAGYNALAPAQKLPAIEALRLTLFSSNIYNQRWKVPPGDIARAIWRGLLAGIKAFPACGLLELQLPAGSGSQDVLFGVLQSDPALATVTPHAAPPPHPHPAAAMALVEFETNKQEQVRDDYEEFDEFKNAPDVTANDPGEQVLQASAAQIRQVVAGIRAAGQLWTQQLAGGGGNAGGLQAAVPMNGLAGQGGHYGAVPPGPASNYDGIGTPLGGPLGEAYDAGRAFPAAITRIPGGKSAEVRQAIRDAASGLRDLRTAVAAAEAAATASATAKNVTDLAVARAFRDAAGRAGAGYVEVARRAYTARRAAEVRKNVIIGGVAGFIVLGTTVGVLVWQFAFRSGDGGTPASGKAGDFSRTYGPRRGTDTAALQLQFELILANKLMDMVNTVTLSKEAGGTWTVNTDKSVQFTAPADPAEKATATYTLALTNGTSLAGTLTANFASDLVAAATDRTMAVRVTARPGFAFLLTPPQSQWSINATQNPPTVTFAPGASFTAPYVRQPFTDTLGGSITLALVILFPAQPLTANPPSRVAVPVEAIPNFVASDEVSVVLLKGTAESTELAETGGKWTVDQGTITFTPDATLPASAAPVQVQYALKYGKTRSAASMASINYPALLNVSALDQTVYVLSRTKPVVIAMAGATLGTAPAGTPGAWSSDAASVIFTPANVPGTGVVTVQTPFTVGSSPGTVKVIFVQPAARSLPSVSRIGGQVSLAPPVGEVLPARASVWLLDNSGRHKSIDIGVGHRWSISADGKGILFTPSPTRFVDDSHAISFVFSDETDQSPPAQATATFSKETVAWAISVSGPATARIDVDVTNFCYVEPPKTITSVTLTNNDPTRIKVGSPASKPTEVTFDPGGMGARMDMANYQVTDSANGKSNIAPLTVTFNAAMSGRARPMAASCLVAKSAAPDQSRVAKVLEGGTAYHGVDVASVKLAGPADLGDGNTVDQAGLAADGKSMYVPNQGSWFVDASGAIVFHADASFSGPPAPVAFTFADLKGNVSAPSVVVFDDKLATVATLPQKVSALDETKFWSDYRTHVSRLHPPLDAGAFLSVTNSMAWATGLAAKPAGNPVGLGDYDTAYQAWLDSGQAWDDPPGTASPVGLVTICEQLVAQAMPAGSPGVLTRYWRLQHMAHMAAQALPDGGGQ